MTESVRGLNGIRAVAALGILAYHAHLGFFLTRGGDPSYLPYLKHLDVAVPIFFVLSAFLLYRPFVRAHFDGTAAPSTRHYYLKRALRILPAYWAVLTVLLVTGRIVLGRRDAVWQYALLQTFSYEHLQQGIVQVWSVCVEVSFYLVLPLLAWSAGRRASTRSADRQLRHELLWVAGLAVTSVAFRIGAPHLIEPKTWRIAPFGYLVIQNITTFWFPSWLEVFAAGMGLAAIEAWCRATGRTPRLLSSRWFPLGGVTLAAAAYWVVCNRVDVPVVGDWRDTIGPALVRQTLYGLVAIGLVAPMALGRFERREPVRSVLSARPLELAGVVSYGVFLVHVAVLGELDGAAWARTAMDHFPTILLLGSATSIAVAALLYFVVERPAQLIARRLGGRATMPVWAQPLSSTSPESGGRPDDGDRDGVPLAAT